MNKYSNNSEKNLKTCHPDLQLLFRTVLPHFDHTIIIGHRGEKAQNQAYENGKSQLKWPYGKHNKKPSIAVDAAPYPIDWHDRERMTLFAGFVKGAAEILKSQGKITHSIRWGGDWSGDTQVKDNNFDDLVHFELIED